MTLAPDDFYYRWFPGRFERKTRRLSLAADGAYRRIIDQLMLDRQPIPADDLQAIARASDAEWLAIWPQIEPFLTLTDRGYTQQTVIEEIAHQDRLAAARKEAGELGAAMRWKKGKHKQKPSGSAMADLWQSHAATANANHQPPEKTHENNPLNSSAIGRLKQKMPEENLPYSDTSESLSRVAPPVPSKTTQNPDPLAATRLGRQARAAALRANLSHNLPEALDLARQVLTAGQFRQLKHEIEVGKITGSIRLNDILQRIEDGG